VASARVADWIPGCVGKTGLVFITLPLGWGGPFQLLLLDAMNENHQFSEHEERHIAVTCFHSLALAWEKGFSERRGEEAVGVGRA
jgi:hypothetical protein